MSSILWLSAIFFLNLFTLFIAWFIGINELIYPHADSNHPVLARTVDVDALEVSIVFCYLGITLAITSLAILLIKGRLIERWKLFSRSSAVLSGGLLAYFSYKLFYFSTIFNDYLLNRP